MSKENGLRDLICPAGCGGTEFTRGVWFSSSGVKMLNITCLRCNFYFDIGAWVDTYDQQLEDMRRVNNASDQS